MRYVIAALIAVFCLSGCMEKRQRTVGEFMEDEAALFGTLQRCETAAAAADDVECRNARQAAERLAVIEERAIKKAREQAFVSAREEYRMRLDRERALRVKAEAEAEAARLEALLNSQEDAVDSGVTVPPAEEQPLPDSGGN